MSTSYLQANTLFYLKDILPVTTLAGGTVRVSGEIETGNPIETGGVDTFVVLKNETQIERMLVTMTGGIMTFVKRGLQQDGITENSSLVKPWNDGAIGYITVKPDDFLSITKLDKIGGLRTGMSPNKVFITDISGNEIEEDLATIIPTSSNLKNSDFIAGEALSAGNAVVIEKLDTQDFRIFSYSVGTPATSTAGTGNNQGGVTANSYQGMRFSVSSTRVFTGGAIISNGGTPPTNWRLLNGSNTVIDSGTISGTTLTPSGATVILNTGIQYKIEVTNPGVTWSSYGGVTSLPVTSGAVTFNYRTIGGADANPNQVESIASINTAPLSELISGKNIGDVTANTRVEHTVWGTGVSGTTMDIQIAKISNPGNLGIRIETDNAGSPSGTLAHANASVSIVNTGIPTNPTSPTIPGSVVTYTVTFPGNFTLALNTKYHIVFFQGTYGSETINSSNYYIISFTSIASTQKSKKWNGSAWSNESSIRKWSSSTLFNSGILAKTSSSIFTYCDGIVENAFNEGQLVTMVTLGETKALSGLTPRTKYYVSNTPGLLTTSAGGIAVGTSKTSGLFNIGGYNIT